MTTSVPAERTSVEPTLSRTAATALSAVFSLALHGTVLAAAIIVWLEDTPGAAPAPTEAVTIELIQTEVLEAIEQADAVAAASPASLAAESGATHEAMPAPAARDIAEPTPEQEIAAVAPPEPETAEDAPKGLELIEGAAVSEEAAGREKPAPTRKKAEQRRDEKPKEPKRPQKTAKLTDPRETGKSEAAPSKKGGAASKANKGSDAAKARASASSGSAVNYAAMVRARVAARKPAGQGSRGTVVIAFGVTRSGSLGYASIARSSGNPGLDRSVLAAVRGASFPAPPPGAGTRFAVPFHFR